MKQKKYTTQSMKLRQIGIRHFDELIHDQSSEWLLHHFSKGADEYPVNTAVLMRNIIWQLRERIIKKEKEPLGELIRTFWYMYIKPTLSRAGALSKKRDQYSDLVNNLVTMVIKHKLMSYKDIGFRDENESNKKAGLNYHIILFAEKYGHWELLKEITNKYQISVISLGGQPSVLSCEYFVSTLKENKANIRKKFYLLSIVDYDTSGWIIRDSFIRNLKAFGIKNIENTDLINPDMLTPEEVEHSKYILPAKEIMKKKNENWIKKINKAGYKNQEYLKPLTNLTTGKTRYFGLEAEAVSTKRLREKIDELVKPLIKKNMDKLKLYQLDHLCSVLEELAVFKIKR